MPTLPVRKFVAPEIAVGIGSRRLVAQYARNLSARRVFLVTDPGVARAGWAGEATDELEDAGLDPAVYDQVSPNPRNDEVMRGADRYQEAGGDLIVAVGGGSVIDCAKAIGAVASNECDVLDLEGVDEVKLPGPPLVCIPTTAGSSADVSQFAIINDQDRRRKIAIVSKSMVPDVSLIDPETTVSMSPRLTAETGMDAMCHAFESYVSNASSVITDLHALEAVRMVRGSLPIVYRDPGDLEHRERVMAGSMFAGLAFSNASLGLVHAMAHSLGGYLDAPHGMCNTLLLEHVIAYNRPVVPERYRTLEAIMAGNGRRGGPDDPISSIGELIERLDIERGLARLGMTEEDIPILSRNAQKDPCLATNPRPAGIEDIARLYHDAL